jgi:nitronate monooxygenase
LPNQLNIKIPIVQAPMAGDATTPELVAAVSNAGALGSIGAGYMSPEKIKQTIEATRALTNKPFSVNLFIPNHISPTKEKMDLAVQGLNQVCHELDVTSEPVCAPFSASFDAQMRVILEEKVPVFSFTFGLLEAKWMKQLKRHATFVIGTATNLEEAHALKAMGVDAIVLQGAEAGGHRGTFLGEPEEKKSLYRPLDLLLFACSLDHYNGSTNNDNQSMD